MDRDAGSRRSHLSPKKPKTKAAGSKKHVAPKKVVPDRELDAGSRAHYDDAAYYTATYAERFEDVQMYVDLGLQAGRVLEYGVGNGRIALPLARHGVKVSGVDHSAPMLADLERRLASEPVEVVRRMKLHVGDMRTVKLRERFPLIICTFNTALHLYTREDVERFFARVKAHLEPDGLFVVDLSMPLAENLARDPERTYGTPPFRHAGSGQIVKYRERFDYDAARQVLFITMEFTPKDAPDDGWMTPLAHRQWQPQEWEALLHYNGFVVEAVHGDFFGGPLTRESDAMIWFSRLAKPTAKKKR